MAEQAVNPGSVDPGALTNAEADAILAQAREWREAGKGVAMATVVSTWGSAPRGVGSQLVLNEDASFMGSVSGGCVEGAVLTEGLEVIADGEPRLLDFGISDDQAWEVGLACGGKLEIFIERVEG